MGFDGFGHLSSPKEFRIKVLHDQKYYKPYKALCFSTRFKPENLVANKV